MSKHTKITIVIIFGFIIGLTYFAYSILFQQDSSDKNLSTELVKNNLNETNNTIQATESTNYAIENAENNLEQKTGWKDEQIKIRLGEKQLLSFSSSIPEGKKWEDVTAIMSTTNWHGLLLDSEDVLSSHTQNTNHLVVFIEQQIDDVTGEELPLCHSGLCHIESIPNKEIPEGWEYLDVTDYVGYGYGYDYGYSNAYRFIAEDKSFVVYVESAQDLTSLEAGYLSEVFKSLKFIEI